MAIFIYPAAGNFVAVVLVWSYYIIIIIMILHGGYRRGCGSGRIHISSKVASGPVFKKKSDSEPLLTSRIKISAIFIECMIKIIYLRLDSDPIFLEEKNRVNSTRVRNPWYKPILNVSSKYHLSYFFLPPFNFCLQTSQVKCIYNCFHLLVKLSYSYTKCKKKVL